MEAILLWKRTQFSKDIYESKSSRSYIANARMKKTVNEMPKHDLLRWGVASSYDIFTIKSENRRSQIAQTLRNLYPVMSSYNFHIHDTRRARITQAETEKKGSGKAIAMHSNEALTNLYTKGQKVDIDYT